MQRRAFLALAACGLLPRPGAAGEAADGPRAATIAAAWRGPRPTDTYHAGVLAADWADRKIDIRRAVPLPTRPHGLTPEADGSLLVVGVRPGAWLMRIDPEGRVERLARLDGEKSAACLNGHVVAGANGLLYTTETDGKTGRGRIGVRDRATLQKIDEWDSHGIEPHQLLTDPAGHLYVANGGIPRAADDKKIDLDRMDASLVRLDGGSGRLLRHWKLDDPRLSLRHLAWSRDAAGKTRLGVAMQAEHDDPRRRAAAPLLAVLDGDELSVPLRATDGDGYAGDIAGAGNGGFALSSNVPGLAQLWQPARPGELAHIVELPEAYALAAWDGPRPGGGVLVATALGLVRWHPAARHAFIPWPQPMALDNHWVLLGEA